MRAFSIFRLRLRSLFVRHKVEQELAEELRYHLERQIDEGIASGMTPQTARHAALRSIDSIEQRKEECRDTRGLNLIDSSVQDLRYAVRQLTKSPGFASIAILTLALGIAAVIAIFGFVDSALIRPLPCRDQSRLVTVYETNAMDTRGNVSFLNYRDWRNLNTVFSSIDAYGGSAGWSFAWSTANRAEHVPGLHVTSGFFRTLGVNPVLGRAFRVGEDSLAAPETVLLSYHIWQKRFYGKSDVLGRVITLDGAPHTIIGVLPKDFHFAPAGPAEFWAPLTGSRNCEQQRPCHSVFTVARLKDGVFIQNALANMKSVASILDREYPRTNHDQGANVLPLRDAVVGEIRPILLMLLSGATLLLFIACMNVSSLLLSRSDARKREIAVRSALGASSSRLFRQFAAEAAVLSFIGCLVGLLSAQWGMGFLGGLIPAEMMENMPYLSGFGVNAHAVATAVAISIGAAALFALTPRLRLSPSELPEGLKEGTRGSAGISWRRFGRKLMIVELALAVVLVVSATMLGKSLYRLLQVNIGIDAHHLATLHVEPPPNYFNEAQFVALERQIVERIASLPGVQSVAVADQLPGASWGGDAGFGVVGHPRPSQNNSALQRKVNYAYLQTVRAHLLRGHYFTPSEAASSRPIAVINETMAKQLFGDEDPVGQ